MEIINSLKDAIKDKNKDEILSLFSEIEEQVKADVDLIGYITEPAVIHELHELLRENFEIHQKMLMLRNRVPSRSRRAILFVQVMKNAVSRIA